MLLSTVTFSVALIVISPACALGSVESGLIPTTIALSPNSPACSLRLRASMATSPPPVPVTFTIAALLKVTSALAASIGKLKLPSLLKVTVPTWLNPPNSILPFVTLRLPPSKLISPPTRVKLFPEDKFNPIISSALLLFCTLERLTISAGLSRKFKPIGALIVNEGGESKSVALYSPSSNDAWRHPPCEARRAAPAAAICRTAIE